MINEKCMGAGTTVVACVPGSLCIVDNDIGKTKALYLRTEISVDVVSRLTHDALLVVCSYHSVAFQVQLHDGITHSSENYFDIVRV